MKRFLAAQMVVAAIFAILALAAVASRYWFSALFWGSLFALVGLPLVAYESGPVGTSS